MRPFSPLQTTDFQPYRHQQPAPINQKAFHRSVSAQAHTILHEVFAFRRMAYINDECQADQCLGCMAPHKESIIAAIRKQEPVTFILPAFPGKSPNTRKVFGPLPDMAEQQALQFLDRLCRRIQSIYAPGAHIILCSDGRVFSDVVGMREEDVTAYQDALDLMIFQLDLKNLSTFNLDRLYDGDHFDLFRQELIDRYGQPLGTLREKVRQGGKGSKNLEDQEAHRLFCGITRFLFEDALHPHQTQSRTALQKESRTKAYQLILRSNAWGDLLAEHFPDAVRLSIHPQTCGSRKLGIQLLGTNPWLTPWHGVAVDTGREFLLMKRWEAEDLGAELVLNEKGDPSHFRLHPQKKDESTW